MFAAFVFSATMSFVFFGSNDNIFSPDAAIFSKLH
jgi:hypothetical protein